MFGPPFLRVLNSNFVHLVKHAPKVRRCYCLITLSSPLAWIWFSVSISDEPETLYKRLSLLVKGHDRAVLDSYEFFAVLAAKELGISVEKVHRPPKTIERFTLLKSVHIFKKHRVQYEMRTHYLCLELKHVTGSTAAVYLEYVQRNLPEGVAMEVKKVSFHPALSPLGRPVTESACIQIWSVGKVRNVCGVVRTIFQILDKETVLLKSTTRWHF
uniref:Small ribosomal subunit protein uS10m n=1 Tax=Nothoprocta perdicaria TaxID=30464 RepID=A0A8C6ZJC9_NOTPE